MKKILNIFLFLLMINTMFFVNINDVNAADVGMTYNLDELKDVTDQSILDFVDGVEITSLDNIDVLEKLSNVRSVWIDGIVIEDFSFINNIEHNLISLSIDSSYVDLSTLTKTNIQNINLTNTFVKDNNLGSINITRLDILNPKLLIDEEYDDQITAIAESIYEEGMSEKEIIKNVSLYVIDNMEFTDAEYENIAQAVLNGKGTCAHYSYFATQLLNKLGITAISNSGLYIDDEEINSHAWVEVYVDSEWYVIDISGIDNEYDREKIVNDEYDDFYMAVSDSMVFAEFTKDFDPRIIPVAELNFDMSILGNSNIKFGNDLYVDYENYFIENLSVGQTVKYIIQNTITNGIVRVLHNNEQLIDTENIITGSILEIELDSEIVEYTLVVSGDITGDGEITMSDVMKAAGQILNKNTIVGDCYLKAADVTGDGKIRMSDVMKLANLVLEGGSL